jgi:hypothetical protein
MLDPAAEFFAACSSSKKTQEYETEMDGIERRNAIIDGMPPQ